MATQDTCCTLVPYFKVSEGKLDEFKVICEQFMEITEKNEPNCLYYGFSIKDDVVHCREGYANAEGLLAHIENAGALLGEALKICEIARLEVHGPEAELAKLRGPLADLNPEFYVLEYGFRR
ncbi:MAG: hypothetical protein DHS20C09_03750 [marine bacterium B5-7]|nr:MAG: hypothetical protein DHS20C09_03750 [marine bacterium B5-7]